jgi:DNA polymerase III epsilon subunit-like protein
MILSWSAKWLGSPTKDVMYMDCRKDINNPKIEDKIILKGIWKLMDEADIILGQNSNNFDIKKLNARFIMHGMQPPSSYRKLDTLQIAKSKFGFTSNKLEYMTKKLNLKYKKLSHSKFSGFELWRECLSGNKAAWNEMKVYNIHDVLATEELYIKLAAWDTSINFDLYSDDGENTCSSCSKSEFTKNGFHYSNNGKYQRWKCLSCGAEMRDKYNLIPTKRRRALRVRTR